MSFEEWWAALADSGMVGHKTAEDRLMKAMCRKAWDAARRETAQQCAEMYKQNLWMTAAAYAEAIGKEFNL